MSKTNNKFRIIDASTNPNISNDIWLNCGVESLIIDSERGGIYRGNNSNLPTKIASKENVIEITYSELKTIKDNKKLEVGKYYKIKDYVTLTKNST
jgi:hypothetical protein